MSEKTLMELFETRQEVWIAMLDARIRRAEAAEVYLEWLLDTPTSSALEDYQSGLRLRREYVAAREAVRKLEVGAFEKAEEACKSMAGEGET